MTCQQASKKKRYMVSSDTHTHTQTLTLTRTHRYNIILWIPPPQQRSSFFDVKIALSTLTDVTICLTDKSVGAALSGKVFFAKISSKTVNMAYIYWNRWPSVLLCYIKRELRCLEMYSSSVLNHRKINFWKFGVYSKFHIFRTVQFFTHLKAKKNSAGPPADPKGLTRHQQGTFQV